MATQNDNNRQILARHLSALEVPIHRIGSRDCILSGDRNALVDHWERLNNNWNSPQEVWDMGHVVDMVIGWNMFTAWGETERVQSVEPRISEIFEDLDDKLRRDLLSERPRSQG